MSRGTAERPLTSGAAVCYPLHPSEDSTTRQTHAGATATERGGGREAAGGNGPKARRAARRAHERGAPKTRPKTSLNGNFGKFFLKFRKIKVPFSETLGATKSGDSTRKPEKKGRAAPPQRADKL